ncbi:MAG: PQQ-dependent sugar dehydrogenase [Armatimonadetes bacterium]|nr:PQQ-dependent sugar dehydrogenase [Armatimonadota bacterium]
MNILLRSRYPGRAAQAIVIGLALAQTSYSQVLVDPALQVVTHQTGLNQPIGIVFLSPNDYFVLEKASGQVKRFTNGIPTGVVLDLAVNSASERGLLSMALHPNFPASPYIYIYWSESSTGIDTTVAADVSLRANRVDRFLWNGSTLAFDRSVLALRAYQADAGQPIRGNHNGGVVRFGPDGKLYAMIGDNGRRGYMQNNLQGPNPDDQFGGPAPDDAHLTGAIFRMNDDGTVPTDNPFYLKTPYRAFDKVYAYGVRNGFGLCFDPSTGSMWTQENGDDAFDEINRVTAGFNGGWIQSMGPISRVNQFRDIEVASGNMQQLRWPPQNLQTNQISAYKRMWKAPGSHYEDPQFSWKYAVAPANMNFLNTGNLGDTYRGTLLVGASRTTLSGGYLFNMKLNESRKGFSFTDPRLNDLVADNAAKFDPAESESLLFGTGFGVVTSVETSPDGRVYLVSLDQGKVLEITRPSFKN